MCYYCRLRFSTNLSAISNVHEGLLAVLSKLSIYLTIALCIVRLTHFTRLSVDCIKLYILLNLKHTHILC